MQAVWASGRQGASLAAATAVTVAIAMAAIPTASAKTVAVAATTCTRDTPAVIHGEHKCLGPGEYCKAAYKHEYLRYGYECVGSPARLRHRRQ
jgi:hypothetical protein